MELHFRGEIRPAQQEDLSAITEIYGHHVSTSTASFEVEPPNTEEMFARWSEVRQHDLPYLVAESKGQITGFAYASRYRARKAYRFTLEDSIYVHPLHLGQRIGHELLASLLDYCGRTDCRQIVAIIGDTANTPSIRLHESFGFHHVGVLESVGFKFNRWIDCVLMQRSIQPVFPKDPLQ